MEVLEVVRRHPVAKTEGFMELEAGEAELEEHSTLKNHHQVGCPLQILMLVQKAKASDHRDSQGNGNA